jgi:hypothetical protein
LPGHRVGVAPLLETSPLMAWPGKNKTQGESTGDFMEFFQDPNEFDDHIIRVLRHDIDYCEWNFVETEIDKHIDIVKSKLCDMHNKLVKVRSLKNIPPYFYFLSECKSVSDVLDSKRHQIFHGPGLFAEYLSGSEEFAECLISLFSIKTLLSGQPFDDEEQVKQEFHTNVDRFQRNLKELMLIFATPKAWSIDRSTAGLDKARPKGGKKSLRSLTEAIREILENDGYDSKPANIFKKLKKYREYNSQYPSIEENEFLYDGLILFWDPESNVFYEKLDNGKGEPKKIIQNTVYDYIRKIKKNS